ncbi:MAG: hypothetical protein H6618_06440 [Deltaproteobacteria bacterium]|nr:hypothetical protein [Deltaproteobacteria bacterium]
MANTAVKSEKVEQDKQSEEEIFIPFGPGLRIPAQVWKSRKQLLAFRKLIDSQLAFIGK